MLHCSTLGKCVAISQVAQMIAAAIAAITSMVAWVMVFFSFLTSGEKVAEPVFQGELYTSLPCLPFVLKVIASPVVSRPSLAQ